MECTRRSFFGQFGSSLVTDFVDAVGALQSGWLSTPPQTANKPEARRWLRPPGALPESQFLSTCTRCTACQKACPYQSIRRLGPEFEIVAGTPAIIPDESPCYLCEDMPCIAACEPRALIPVPRTEVRMGLAVIDTSACYVAQGQPCDYCVTRCPLRDVAIVWDESGLPRIVEGSCTGCGVCAYLCPARAIAILGTVTHLGRQK